MNTTNNAVTITGSGKIAAFVNGQSYAIDTDHPNYHILLDAVKNGFWHKFVEYADVSRQLNAYLSHGITIKDGILVYNDEELHNSLTKRIISFVQQDLPFEPLVKFLENLMLNPSKRAVDELYDFLEVGELPITEDGCFLAYKNVKADYKDIHSGTFDNSVGKVCEMPRNRVDEDKDRTCSYGLHFCSIAYLPHFRDSSGGHTMIVKINPKDVVAIPADYNNTKGRTCRYEVVAEYTDDWRSKLDRGENGFDSDLYDEDGNEYDDDEELGNCCSCKLELNNENYNGNGDNLCDNCYDDEYSGCYGGGCAGKTTNEEPTMSDYLDKKCGYTYTEEDTVGNEGRDGCCGGQCGCHENQNTSKPTPTPTAYHNVRDEKGRFIKKNQDTTTVLNALKNFFKKATQSKED